MTAIVIRGGRSAKASRDLRWTTESRALGDASGFGHDLSFGPQAEVPLERRLHLDCCHSVCARKEHLSDVRRQERRVPHLAGKTS